MAIQPIQQPYNPFEHIMQQRFPTYIVALPGGKQIELRIEDIRRLSKQCESIIEAYDFDEPHAGPTPRQLKENIALKNAWEEFLVVKKLAGV